MDKLKMSTPDLTAENIKKVSEFLKNIFPECVKEAEDEEGNLVEKIDFDLLKTELGNETVEGLDERYRLDWPGKKRSILKANTPINKTLRPVREDSVDWDNTGNLYIEGDNFEVLKILQESYLGKVKMIYIDPPYNTGNDFVYNDNFAEDSEEYKERTEQDAEGYKMVRNLESNGRFHSDRLSMMYERLKVARDLLKDDGVIFISIDDNEQSNLKKICDEIFGESNFINCICINMSNMSGPKIMHAINGKRFPKIKEYLLIYGKDTNKYHLSIPKIQKEEWDDEYNLIIPEMDENLYDDLTSGKRIDELNNLHIYSVKSYCKENNIEDTNDWKNENSYRIFASKPNTALLKKASDMEFNSEIACITNPSGDYKLIKTDFNRDTKTARIELVSAYKNSSSFLGDHRSDIVTTGGVGQEGGVPFENGKKPLKLLKRIINSSCIDGDIILDFFSGSATTAHACMQLNAEDGGDRKYIMVQLPELCNEESEAYKAGYKNICEIGKERIRRAGKKIKEETGADIDYGFRVYRVDESCMKDVYYHPSQAKQENIGLFVSNIKDDRTSEDLLTQVILNLGLTLDLPIEEKRIGNNKVFYVAGNSLVACFDENVDFSIIEEIAKDQPLKMVLRDSSFRSDADRINFENTMKELSRDTIIRVI